MGMFDSFTSGDCDYVCVSACVLWGSSKDEMNPPCLYKDSHHYIATEPELIINLFTVPWSFNYITINAACL